MRLWRSVLILAIVVLSGACSSQPAAPPSPPKVDESGTIQTLKNVNQAQADFIHRTRRYAQSFDELKAQHLMNAEPDEQTLGYKFQLHPSADAVSYTLTATPADAAVRYFFTDQTEVIRSETGKPATAESPAVTN
jgi:hypothetical protein